MRQVFFPQIMKLAQDQSQIKRIRIWNQVCLASTLRSTISRRLCWISLKVASPATFGRECSEPWPLSPSSTHRVHPRQTDAKPRKGPLKSLPMSHHQRLSFHLFYPKSTFHDMDLNKTCRTLLLVILTQSFIFFFFFFGSVRRLLKMVKDQILPRLIISLRRTDPSVAKRRPGGKVKLHSTSPSSAHSSLPLCQCKNLQQIVSLWRGASPRKYKLNFK